MFLEFLQPPPLWSPLKSGPSPNCMQDAGPTRLCDAGPVCVPATIISSPPLLTLTPLPEPKLLLEVYEPPQVAADLFIHSARPPAVCAHRRGRPAVQTLFPHFSRVDRWGRKRQLQTEVFRAEHHGIPPSGWEHL